MRLERDVYKAPGCRRTLPGRPSERTPVKLSAAWATGCGFVAILLWSGTFALARSLSEKLGPFTSGAAVYAAGVAFCYLGKFARRRTGMDTGAQLDRRYLWGCGALFALYTLLIYAAVGMARDRLQLLEVALVNYLWPAATVVLSLPLLRHRAHPILWPATLIALAGVFLVLTQGADVSWRAFAGHLRSTPGVYLIAFGAAVSWGLYSNLSRRWGPANGEGGVVMFIGVSSLCLAVLRFVFGEASAWTGVALAEVLALGLITALAYELWDVAMRRGNLNMVAAASYGTPLLSTLVSQFYLGVTPSPQLWWGCLLIVGGSLLSWWAVDSRMRREKSRGLSGK